MSPMVLALPGGERLAARLHRTLRGSDGALSVHRFPDGEIRVRIEGDPRGRVVVLVGSLDRPDEKVLPFLFAGVNAPWIVMAKRRLGDHAVELTLPRIGGLEGRHPVLVDDMVSSGGTVRAASRLLAAAQLPLQWVVAVHAVADPLTAEALEREAGIELVTCNTILHPSNRIDVSDAIRATLELRLPPGVVAESAAAVR